MASYCRIAPKHPVHGSYHETEYGFPQEDEHILFERMVLEIMQAGLSWEIVLKKRAALKKAFKGFKVTKVARFGATETKQLLNNPEIIRNRLKIAAVIENAKRVQNMRKAYGGLYSFLDQHHPLTKKAWTKLFKDHFLFMGGEIVGEFLMSLGYLPGAHDEKCPIYKKLRRINPPWLRAAKKGFNYSS